MTDAVAVAIILAAPGAIASIISSYFSYRAAIHSKAAAISSKNAEETTNRKMEELLQLTKKSSYAEGKLASHDETISS
jgi:hypothetical protein